MSNARKAQRKLEVAECRRLGAQAFAEGKPASANPWKPYESNNSGHWKGAYDAAKAEAERSAVVEKYCVVTDAISEVDDASTQEALYAIFNYMWEHMK